MIDRNGSRLTNPLSISTLIYRYLLGGRIGVLIGTPYAGARVAVAMASATTSALSKKPSEN